MRCPIILAALALSLSPCAAQQIEARKPGSVLIFPGHRSGPSGFTILSVTNTNEVPATPETFGGSINLHFEYVNTVANPDNPFCPHDCVIFDRHELLTPADTLSVLTFCHNSAAPGVDEGYVVVSAQDPAQFDVDICFDYLAGSLMSFNASGMFFSLNAEPIQCADGLQEGQATDLNNNGDLDFDGNEYKMLPDTLIIESFIAVPRTRLCLINLTGECTDTNSLYFSVFNDNEFPLSATLQFKIWFDQPLVNVNPVFDGAFLASVPNDPEELDVFCNGEGLLETGWSTIQSIGVHNPGGGKVARDGAILGCIVSGIGGDPLLWRSNESQDNGLFIGRSASDD